MIKIYAYTNCDSLSGEEYKSDNYHVVFATNNLAKANTKSNIVFISEMKNLGNVPLYIKIAKLVSHLTPKNKIGGVIVALEESNLNDNCTNKDNMIKIIVTRKEIK